MDVTKTTESPDSTEATDSTEAATFHTSMPTGGVVALVVLALVLVTFVLLVLGYCLSRRTRKKVTRRGEFARVNDNLETMREGDIQLQLDIPTIVINKNYVCPPSPSIFSSINTTCGLTFELLHEYKSVSMLALHSVDLNTSSDSEETDEEVRVMVVSLLDLVLVSVVDMVSQEGQEDRQTTERSQDLIEKLLIEPLSVEEPVSPPDLQHTGPNTLTNISLLSPRSEAASHDTTVSTTSVQFLTPRMEMTPTCSTSRMEMTPTCSTPRMEMSLPCSTPRMEMTTCSTPRMVMTPPWSTPFEISLFVTPPSSSPVSTPPQTFPPPPIYTESPLPPHLVAPSLTRRLSFSHISLPDSNCSPTVTLQSSREEEGGFVRKLDLVSSPLDVNVVIQNGKVD